MGDDIDVGTLTVSHLATVKYGGNSENYCLYLKIRNSSRTQDTRQPAIVRLLMTLIACCSKILRSWTFADATPVSACSADFLAGLVAHCYYWHYCVIINNIYPKWGNSIFSSIFLKVQGFDNGDLGLPQQPLGLFPGLKTLTQHFYGGENEHFYQNY